MKILVLNDTHISGINSINRKGDYFADCLLKLDETIELSKQCDHVIHSGDFFHTAVVANNILDEVLDRIEAAQIPWYVLPGNHDEIGANWENSTGSSLNHMFRRSQYVHLLTEEDYEGLKLYIKGYPYYYNVEEDIKKNGLIHKKKGYFTIAITHAFIAPKKFRDDVLHVEIKDIETNYDLVMCSHFHNDTGITQKGKTDFINVGAWGRRSISEGTHKPKVVIIDTNKKFWDIIELKSAKEEKDIFDINAHEDEKMNEREMAMFIDSLKNFQNQEADVPIEETIKYICKTQNIEQTVTNRILKKLAEIKQKEK